MPPRRIIPVDMDMSVAMAFFNTIGTWAKAVENGETEEGELQLKKLEILGHKMADGDAFKRRFASANSKLDAIEMLGCLCDYLSILTQVAPSRIDRYVEESASGD